MNKYLITYAVDKTDIKETVIEETTFTQAYVRFLILYPSDYEIVEIIPQ